jgi:hypothetical protein
MFEPSFNIQLMMVMIVTATFFYEDSPQANHVSYADPVFRARVVCNVCLTPHAGWGWLFVMSLPAKIRYLVPDI